MFRKAEQKFQEWKNNPDKKALLVTGGTSNRKNVLGASIRKGEL